MVIVACHTFYSIGVTPCSLVIELRICGLMTRLYKRVMHPCDCTGAALPFPVGLHVKVVCTVVAATLAKEWHVRAPISLSRSYNASECTQVFGKHFQPYCYTGNQLQF